MKFVYSIVLCFFLFLIACSPGDFPAPIIKGQGTVNLMFIAESGIKTRTLLSGSENLQHVSVVYLYVFSGMTDNAEYVLTKQIPWTDASDSNVNYQTVERSYSVNLPAGDYTFLAIGLDDQSGVTYDLPAGISNGTTLSNAVASLATGKTKDDIAVSELFAGTVSASVAENTASDVTVSLLRRVAGVMGWFTNIPSDVTDIQIALYTQQNKSSYLKARTEGTTPPIGISNPENFKDYITNPVGDLVNGGILVSVNVPAGTTATTILSGGSYVLPAAAPAVGDGSEYTLQVNMISGGTVLKSIRTQLKPDDNLYIPPSASDVASPFRFPIVANCFYGVGTQNAPVDLGGDDDAVYIEINANWSKIVDVPFE